MCEKNILYKTLKTTLTTGVGWLLTLMVKQHSTASFLTLNNKMKSFC